MKKVIFGLLIIFGLSAGSVNAQVTYGVKVNANMSNFITSDINSETGMSTWAGWPYNSLPF